MKRPDINKYVVGFLFNDDASAVVLIEKQRPEWQRGKLNGVGGHIENGESPVVAICREFEEETGASVESWKLFCVLTGLEKRYLRTAEQFEVWFFAAFNSLALAAVHQTTDEAPSINRVLYLPILSTLPNLQWLIPMALSFCSGECADHYIIEERESVIEELL